MLAELREHYHCDASTILKRGLYELAEDASDNRIAERFEKNAKTSKPEFLSAEDIIATLK